MLTTINVGSKINGVTNILIDNQTGMRDILNHLIHTHDYKRFGFLRGPEDNLDSKIRFKTFIDVLTQNNLQVDPNQISSPGSWSIDWGVAGTRELLEKTIVNWM